MRTAAAGFAPSRHARNRLATCLALLLRPLTPSPRSISRSCGRSRSILGSAVEHWRNWDAERRRRERLDRLETISRDAREWLLACHWPGNVRELRNAIERVILLCDGGLITREHLSAALSRPEPASTDGLSTADARGNKSKAARLLGFTRAQVYSRLEKHSLSA